MMIDEGQRDEKTRVPWGPAASEEGEGGFLGTQVW